MRLTAAARRKTQNRQTVRPSSLPAPTGGWDVLNAIAAMKPDRAVTLQNWTPRTGYIEPRRGFREWCGNEDNKTDPVETLMCYFAPTSGDNQLFAIIDDTIYDVTDFTTGGDATSVTGLSTARGQYTNFTNASLTHFLIVCFGDGTTTAQIYDGSTWAALSVTGVAEEDLIQPLAYNGRLWFVEADSNVAWYLPLGAITGACIAFPLGSFMNLGGSLQTIASWSVDSRQTVNDYLAFITSEGEVIVYVGTDPSSGNTWQRVGQYIIGRPIGRRCAVKIGGDLAIITEDGITSMNTMMISDRGGAKREAITNTIDGAINDATELYELNFGWEFVPYYHDSLAILNIPVQENVAATQFVYNIITQAWASWSGINACCWAIWDTVDDGDLIMFGGTNGKTYQFDYDSSDDGETISATAQGAFNYLKARGQNKRFTLIRPILTTDGQVSPGVGINIDFGSDGYVSAPSIASGSGAEWDEAIWDTDVWPAAAAGTTTAYWQTVGGLGYCVSVIVQVQTQATGFKQGVLLQWSSTDIQYEPGGPF
jgi:hypothetical protein